MFTLASTSCAYCPVATCRRPCFGVFVKVGVVCCWLLSWLCGGCSGPTAWCQVQLPTQAIWCGMHGWVILLSIGMPSSCTPYPAKQLSASQHIIAGVCVGVIHAANTAAGLITPRAWGKPPHSLSIFKRTAAHKLRKCGEVCSLLYRTSARSAGVRCLFSVGGPVVVADRHGTRSFPDDCCQGAGCMFLSYSLSGSQQGLRDRPKQTTGRHPVLSVLISIWSLLLTMSAAMLCWDGPVS
jgi:hypothetical protein